MMPTNELLQTIMEPEAISVAEAARRAGLGRSTFYEAIARGDVPTIKFGKRRLVRLESLRAWLRELEQLQAVRPQVRS